MLTVLELEVGPDGLVLMPSVFIWPDWSVKKMTSTQTTLLYPARGAGCVWDEADLRFPGPELGDGAVATASS